MGTDSRISLTFGLFCKKAESPHGHPLKLSAVSAAPSAPGVPVPAHTAIINVDGDPPRPFAVVAVTGPSLSADHPSLLDFVALKARAQRASYFVTWNLRDTCLWQTPKKGEAVSKEFLVKNYFDIFEIGPDPAQELGAPVRVSLEERAGEILYDLAKLYRDGHLLLVDIDPTFFVNRLTEAVSTLCPPVKDSLVLTIERDPKFRKEIEDWAVLQGIPGDVKSDDFVESVSRQIVYRLLGKIIFYQSLHRQARHLPELNLSGVDSSQVIPTLRACFAKALEIDYHAVFREDIVDRVPFPQAAVTELARLVTDLNTRDFAHLPQDVVGQVFERLIPREERHSLGQYFTREDLVDLINAFCIRSPNDTVLDPTCGTGTFLIRTYDRLRWMGRHDHQKLLSQLWGVDIAPFPAELATINLFRQKVQEPGNFPRIICEDFFKLKPGQTFKFPPPKASLERPEFIDEPLPAFDAVVGNFPYISQDQIEKRLKGYKDLIGKVLAEGWFLEYPDCFQLSKQDQKEYEKYKRVGSPLDAFISKAEIKISTYADIYVYLFFQTARFLKARWPDGNRYL